MPQGGGASSSARRTGRAGVPPPAASPLQRATIPVQDALQIVIIRDKALVEDVWVGFRTPLEPYLSAHVRLRKEHAAALPAAMILFLPPIGRSVRNMSMTDDAFVGDVIHALQLFDEAAYRAELRRTHIFVMVADTCNPDRDSVEIFFTVPERPPGMERLSVAVHYAVNRPILGHAVVRLAASPHSESLFSELLAGASVV